MSMMRPGRLGAFAVVLVLLGGAGAWLARPDDQAARVVDGVQVRDGWKQLEYHAVRLSIPGDWERQSSDGCVVEVEHWGPPGTAACGTRPGVAFPDPTTFDTAHEPDTVVQVGPDGSAWSGYVRAADVVVSVSDEESSVVRAVLSSVSVEGFEPIG